VGQQSDRVFLDSLIQKENMTVRTRFGIWILTLTVGLLLSTGRARAAYDNTNYARFHDWQDMGCRMSPGGVGAPSSGAEQAGGNQAHCTICGGAGGRPAWWVDEPYLNLFVADEPLAYTCSSGQRLSFRFAYRQRYQLPQPDECPNWYLAGGAPQPRSSGDRYLENGLHGYGMTNACWGHNWLLDMMFWDQAYETGQSTVPYSRYEAWVWRPEGGIQYFLTNVNGVTVLSEAQSRVRLQPLSALGRPTANTAPPGLDGIYWGEPATNGFRLLYPDGSQDVLSLCHQAGGAGSSTAHAFLTKRIDPQGRATRVGYEWFKFQWGLLSGQYTMVFRVRYVVDPDGRTNTFVYDNTSRLQPWQLIEIDDAYGRKAQMGYVGGVLSSITDAAGLPSSFTYLPYGGWLTSLTTPYGTTSFTWTDTTGQTNGVGQRALLVSEPNSAYQLYYYRHNSQTYVPGTTTNVPTIAGTFDTGSVGANLPQLYYRNSFYWDRRQTAAFPPNFWQDLQGFPPSFPSALTRLSTNDYNRARLRHWLWGADGISISESLSSERDPTPDPAGGSEGARAWYDYASKPSPEVAGYPQVGCVARRLLDNTTQYTRYSYWQGSPPWWDGLLKYNESSYTQPNGTVGVRTNGYYYSNNGVDLLSVTNSLGQWANLAYNALHQVTSVTNALNQVSSLVWDSLSANLRQVSLPSGQTMSYDYYDPAHPTNWPLTSTSSLLKQITLQPQGLTNLVLYYTNGLPRVVTTIGPGLPALTVTNYWDGLNRLTGTAFPDGTTTSNVYDRLHLGAAKDRMGKWTGYGYDPLEHLTTITNALTNVTTLGWCDCGALSSIIDALGTHTNRFTYDNQGLLTGISFADGSSLTYTRDWLGRVFQVADGQGRAVTVGYNNQGLPTIVSGAYGLLGAVVFDAADRPWQVTSTEAVTMTHQFDLLNRLTNRLWADGIGEGFGWSTNGLVAYTNRNGKVTHLARDGAGRLTGVTNANQEVTQFGYNALNEMSSLTDGRTNRTTWNFDGYGWLINRVDALSHEVLHLYRDANGQVTNRWTRQFGNTLCTWDAVGNLKTISNAAQALIGFTYDADNRLQTMADAVGTTTFGYTPVGQLQREIGPWPSSTLTYSYSQQLRQTLTLTQPGGDWVETYVPDPMARRLQSLSSPAGTFGYTFDTQRSTLPTLLTLPNSAWITNHCDWLARLDYTALVNRWGHVLDGYAYTHDLLGLRTNIVRDLGLTNSGVTVGYDNVGQITSWSAREGSNAVLRLNEQLNLVYDKAGNLLSRTNGGLVQTLNCDALNQLTNVTRNNLMTVGGVTPAPASTVTVNGQPAQIYGDFTFARTNVSLSGGNNSFTNIAQSASGLRVTNTLNASLPWTINLLWDSNGNLTNDGTRSFAYDAENRLVTNWVSGAWKTEFVYDGLGRRRIERDYAWQGVNWYKTNELRFVYDGWLPIQERDANNNVLVTYTRGLDLSATLGGAGGIGGLLARTDSGGSTFYHADGAGNITGVMDGQQNMAARYMYGTFGRLVSKWGPLADVNTMQFSSMPTHRQSGLSLYPFRAYDSGLQRWLSRDPIGEQGGINLYGFVGNNPMSRVDPYGLEDFLMMDFTTDFNSPASQQGYAEGAEAVANFIDKNVLAPLLSNPGNGIVGAEFQGPALQMVRAETEGMLAELQRLTANEAREGAETLLPRLMGLARKLYPKLCGNFNHHHVDPKYIGGDPKGPIVVLEAPYHQLISNAFRNEWGYGQTPPPLNVKQNIITTVYSQYPLPKPPQ
jgi:RHS repeat-associated protein